MALPSSGVISISDILTEGGVSASQTATMQGLVNGTYFTINTYSPSIPSTTAPLLMSDWYDYDQTAAKYYWDLSNDIRWAGAADKPLATTSEDWSISLWIRPQWAATDLNLTVYDLSPSGTTSNANRFFLSYDYGFNRFVARYRSNSLNFDRQWNLHANNSATGTGTNSTDRWTAANRGNVNSNGFVNIIVSYDASQTSAADAFKIYWNATELTATVVSNSNTRSTLSLDELTFCGNDDNTGGSRIADYMYMHMWDQITSGTNVTTMYNSGIPISASAAGYTTNLIFGDTSTSTPTVGDPDDSINYDFESANGQTVVAL
tara:strand:- start:32 stop:988 length:957 start_codon:yes stop_codon:yes gene_type:complete